MSALVKADSFLALKFLADTLFSRLLEKPIGQFHIEVIISQPGIVRAMTGECAADDVEEVYSCPGGNKKCC